jgi:uncharacterized protein
MSTTKGRFVWYDLMTTDVDAAKAFYSEVIGYKTQAWDGPMPYSMWCVGDQPVGGVMALPEEVQKAGVPPHWLAYVAVDDVDASAKQAASLGGTILKGGTDIPTVGRFAVIADPQGAAIALFKSATHMKRDDGDPRPGDFTWHELNTTDHKAAWKFYHGLFGWKHTSSMDMGPGMGDYFMFDRSDAPEGKACGGLSDMAKVQGIPPHWLYYTTVDDIDGAIERIKQHGGKLLNGPMEVPGGDKVAQCQDPQGGAFAIHWRNPNPG